MKAPKQKKKHDGFDLDNEKVRADSEDEDPELE